MIIVHATDCYLPRIGGIEVHVRDLTERQRRSGHRVLVATRTAATATNDDGTLRDRDLEGDWLERLDPDVVHVHMSVISPFAFATARRAARAGIPTVITVHSLWAGLPSAGLMLRGLIGLGGGPIVWTAVSAQAAVHVARVVGRDVAVIPNAVDVEFWRPRSHSSAAPSPTVLSVMRLTSVKRALPLIRMLHRLGERAGTRGVIVGDGPRRAAVERYIRRHGLEDRVRLTGVLDRRGVRHEMARAAVFLAPARRESFGIAALEARTAGLPVVAHSASGVASFIRHGVEGLLGGSDGEMTEHALSLLCDPQLRERIGRHNRTVPPDLTWSCALVSNLDAYRRAGAPPPATVAGPHGGRPRPLVVT